jgi:hypothetical protein
VPVEIAPDGGRPRRTDREGVIEIAFGCGARVRLRGEMVWGRRRGDGTIVAATLTDGVP